MVSFETISILRIKYLVYTSAILVLSDSKKEWLPYIFVRFSKEIQIYVYICTR